MFLLFFLCLRCLTYCQKNLPRIYIGWPSGRFFFTFYGTNWHSQGKGGGLALASNHLDIRSSSILWVPWINFINILCQRFMNCVSLNPKNLRHNELQRNILLSDCPSNWHFIKKKRWHGGKETTSLIKNEILVQFWQGREFYWLQGLYPRDFKGNLCNPKFCSQLKWSNAVKGKLNHLYFLT